MITKLLLRLSDRNSNKLRKWGRKWISSRHKFIVLCRNRININFQYQTYPKKWINSDHKFQKLGVTICTFRVSTNCWYKNTTICTQNIPITNNRLMPSSSRWRNWLFCWRRIWATHKCTKIKWKVHHISCWHLKISIRKSCTELKNKFKCLELRTKCMRLESNSCCNRTSHFWNRTLFLGTSEKRMRGWEWNCKIYNSSLETNNNTFMTKLE